MGDEGGFAPNLKSNDEALEVVLEAITKAGYKPGDQVGIALDPAASEFYDKAKGKYVFKKSDKSERTSQQMVEFWANWVRQYPIISIEDGMAEDDWDGGKAMTDALGNKITSDDSKLLPAGESIDVQILIPEPVLVQVVRSAGLVALQVGG